MRERHESSQMVIPLGNAADRLGEALERILRNGDVPQRGRNFRDDPVI